MSVEIVGVFPASRVVDGKKSSYWSTDDSIRTASLTLDFGEPISFNRILLRSISDWGSV